MSAATVLDNSSTYHKRRRGKRGGQFRGRAGKIRNMDRKFIRVVSRNCRSHDRRRTVIEKLLVSNRVVMVQETKRKSRPAYDENDFYTFFKPSSQDGNAKRGLLTLVRKPAQVSEITTPPSAVETQAISMIVGKEEYILVNVYVPGDALRSAGDWMDVLNPLLALGKRVVICGDFNARSPMWLDTGSNTNGKALEEALPEIEGLILNNDAPTRIAERASDADSAIDITLVSPGIAAELRWKLLPAMGSDHRPVLTSIATPVDRHPNPRKKTVFKYKLSGKTVIRICRKSAKERGRLAGQQKKSHCPAWMNVEVEEAWNCKLAASRDYTKAKKERRDLSIIEEKRASFNKRTAEFKSTADQARQNAWDKFCEECDPSDLAIGSKFWQLAKQLKSRASGGVPGPQEIIGLKGERLRTDEEKGEAFKTRYISQLQANSEQKANKAWTDVDELIRYEESGESEPRVDMFELDGILNTIRKDSSPGPDGVKYSDVKALDPAGKTEIIDLINESMLEGKIPEDWKDCNLAVLPKPNKDHTKLKGYRIITMANVWIKVSEKLAARRLVRDLENRGCLPPGVGGARPRRSTTSNIEATTHRIQQAMQRHQHTAVGIFDLEDAYNSVDIGILASKMSTIGISEVMVRWVLAMLGSRKCSMKFGSWRSEAFQVSSGLPQGSPLSSVLFNIYTADLVPCLQSPSTVGSTFVDDIIAESQGNTQQEAVTGLQNACDKLCTWTRANNMVIQPDKSSWMLASLGHRKTNFMVSYEGEEVAQEDRIIGLGVALDYRMTMNAHLEHLRQRTLKGVAMLKYAAAQNVTQASLSKLMKATICSRSDYGLHLTHCASRKAVDGLQRVENQAMRIVTGAARGTSCAALRYWLDIHSIADRQRLLGAKEIMRAARTESHPLYEEITYREDEQTPQRLATVKSWVRFAREEVEAICPIENIKDDEWIMHPCQNLTTETIGSRAWRDIAGERNNAIVREVLEMKAPTIIIATDGSVREDVTAWGGAVWREGILVFEWSAGKQGRSSSFRSECEAMEDALMWLRDNAQEDDKVVILTDSLSLVSKLQRNWIKRSWRPLVQALNVPTVIIYIPGHAGIQFNEKADSLAGAAIPFGNLELTANDICAAISGTIWEGELSSDLTFSMRRLQEYEITRGEGASCLLRGRSRITASQHQMGVISSGTLVELLELFGGRGPVRTPESLLF